MNYLIIEDEPLALDELVRMLQNLDDDFNLVGSSDSVTDSVLWLKNNPQPDIIFMDIHLSDSVCFDIFSQVEIKSPVIFTTAYDQYAIEAFKTNGIAYLLKPIEEEELAGALQKYRNLVQPQTAAHQLGSLDQQIRQLLESSGNNVSQYKERILAKVGDNYQHLPVSQIAYFYSEDHYTFAATHDNMRYIINYTLDNLVEILNPKDFFRISRQVIIGIDSIQSVSKHFNGRLKIVIEPSYTEELFVSRNRVQPFLAWLDGENVTIQ